MTEFFMPMRPPTATAQQKGQNRKTGKYYKPQNLKDAEALYMAYLAPHRPPEPMNGAVRLEAYFYFPTDDPKKVGVPKTTKPDTDNMIKPLKDCMTRLMFWHDDAQVALDVTGKYWSNRPGVFIRFSKIENEGMDE